MTGNNMWHILLVWRDVLFFGVRVPRDGLPVIEKSRLYQQPVEELETLRKKEVAYCCETFAGRSETFEGSAAG